MTKWLKRAAIGGVALFLLIQFVPYGWRHSNPPVTSAAPWPDQASERIARDACYDCHSNETDWPVYSYVAPMSWLVRRDVEEGRDEFNFSEWDESADDADDGAETVEEGSMPPRQYELLHPSAKLSDDEERRLIAALEAMDEGGGGGDDGGSGRGRGRGGDDD